MEKVLRGSERHEHSAVFEAVGRFHDADDMEGCMSNGHMAIKSGAEKIRRPLPQGNVVGVLAKVGAIARHPDSLTHARVIGSDAEARDDWIAGAGHNAEENGVGVRHHGPLRDRIDGGLWDITEE